MGSADMLMYLQVDFVWNWYGLRRFAKREDVDNKANGFLKDDTLIIRYQQEVVHTSGGTLPSPCPAQDQDRFAVSSTSCSPAM